MDADHFDALARSLTVAGTRRGALTALAGSVGLFGLTAAAKKKGGKKKGGKKKKDCPKSQPIPCGDKCCNIFEGCRKGKCVGHCNDGEKNFGETDTDCGGSCRNVRKCRQGQSCVEGADCFNNVCNGSVCTECRIDSDCDGLGNPLRFRCSSEFCFECIANFDCPRPGQSAAQTVCINKRCVECASGADCPAARPFCMTETNEECVDNAVRPCACRACRDEVDCNPGQVCNDEDGSCVECVSDPDCASRPDLPFCVGNVCRQCAQDTDCATAGDVCVQGTCRTPATCIAGRDLCTQGFGGDTACGAGCRCHTTTESGTRCVGALEFSCTAQAACTSRAECEARHGPGAFCVQDTGNFCGCAFCALQCTG
jgi:hypothetical protein